MFDTMVESQPQGAVRSRRNYFAITTIAMSVLSMTAVVVSIFADDFSLGSGAFELTELIAPVEMAAVAPERPQPRQTTPSTQTNTRTAVRTENVLNVAEISDKVPPVSTTPSTVVARPLDGKFEIGRFNSDPAITGVVGTDTGRSTSVDNGPGLAVRSIASTVKDDEPEAPRVERKPETPKVKSGGVLNGQAVDLPKPLYSAAARALHAQGKVTVQVLLDESGRVISASAVDGNVLLRSAAEAAAKRARFTPTLLSGVPVKVTGVIVYNFVV